MTEPFADRPDLVVTIDDKKMLTPKGIGVMLGIGEDEVNAEYARQTEHGGVFDLPPAWKRRTNELMAWNNTNDRFKLLRIALDEQERQGGQ